MRIAHVITLFLPEFVGGATLACARVARALRARGHEVAIFCGRPGADASPTGVHEWEVDGLPVTGVDAASGYVTLDVRGYRHPALTPHFERFLDRHRPEVVHFHSLQALGVTVVEAAAARGIPVVVTMHDWWWFCLRLFLVDPAGFVCAACVDSARCHCAPGFDLAARRRDLDAVLAGVDRVLTPSRFLADAAIANGVARTRVDVCPNGVDLPRATVRRRPGPVRFGYFGGPDNRLKGLPTLLAAAAALDVGGWQLRLWSVPAAEARVPLAILDRVAHRPAFAPAELANVLAGLDCLVVPSLMRESYSLVTREALAAGVPVIASDSGGPAEIVRPGVNGFVFATGDAGDLAGRMRRLILDPALRDRVTAGAGATGVPSVAAQVDQLERIYADLVAAPAAEVAAGGVAREVAADGGAGTDSRARHAPQPRAQPTSLRHVLFVTGIDGSPFRYRVTHLRDQLRTRGVESRALYYTDPDIMQAIATADMVIVYRVPMDGWVAGWLRKARALERPLVFSCDDLIFDPEAAPMDALARLPEGHRAGWLAYIDRYAATLRACDAFVGATEPLVAAAARAGVPGFVVRNGLGTAELTVAEDARCRAFARAGGHDVLRIAYASGTMMHDLDFALVEGTLATLLREVAPLRLRLIGYLRTGAALAPFADRIERLPFLSWPRFLTALSEVDVNLAPLRPEVFSDAKSEVKFLEAAVLGVPTVASPTAAFRHAIAPGRNGLLAATADEWLNGLRALVDDAGARRRLGNAARDDVWLHATPAAQADTLFDVLTTIRGSRPRSAATPPIAGVAAEPAARGGRYALEPDDALPGGAQPARDAATPPLDHGHSVGQTFVCEADNLARIDVCVATEAGSAAPPLLVRVLDGAAPDARELGHALTAGGPVAEDAWIAAELGPLGATRGTTLYFSVELAPAAALPAANAGAAAGTPIRLRTYVTGWGEGPPSGLHVDHRPTPGSLAFRTFHRPRRALTRPAVSPSPSPSPP